jgi:hypothetical protein
LSRRHWIRGALRKKDASPAVDVPNCRLDHRQRSAIDKESLFPYHGNPARLAKKTSKNQLTLPKAIVEHFPDVDYFNVREEGGRTETSANSCFARAPRIRIVGVRSARTGLVRTVCQRGQGRDRIASSMLFERVRVDHGTAVWPGEVDVAPETVYDDSISLAGDPRDRVIQHP